MNLARIRQAVLLMVVVLSGLLIILSYLIYRAYEEKRQDFAITVNTALVNAVYEFDRNQIENRLLETQSAQELVDDAIRSQEKDSLRLKKSENSVYISHIDQSKSYNSQADDYNEEGILLSQQLQRNILQRKDFGSIKSIFRDLLKRYLIAPNQNIDFELLNSNIQKELKKQDIHLNYDFALYDDFNFNFIYTSNPRISKEYFESKFRIPLYYLNLNNAVVISIVFSGLKLYFLKQIALLLILSLFMMGSIVTLFIYSIRTIYEQKRIGELKNDLINNIAHELKTPISTISLACQAMNDEDMMKIDSIRNKYIQMVNAENQRLNTLVESVLKSTMLEESNIPLNITQTNIHDLLEYSIESFELQLKKKNFSVEREFLAKNYVINADEEQFLHVVFNLIDNAIKYCGMNNSSPKLIIRTKNEVGKLKIEFEDNGIGIEQSQQLLVFDKLYRVASGNLHNVKGYGLGLSYVKSVVEKHGGSIHLKSDLNKGSIFTITLPT